MLALKVRLGPVMRQERPADGQSAESNYKEYALRRDIELQDLAGRPLPDGSEYRAVFREYSCPGCASLLQTDTWCPTLGGEEDLWGIKITLT